MSKPLSKPLGLSFFEGNTDKGVQQAKGLCVFPSAPGLATIEEDTRYRDALVAADYRFVDSGFLALCWFFLRFRRLSRISGLRFIKAFLASKRLVNTKSLWIHPSDAQRARNVDYLLKVGIPESDQLHYLAPIYPKEGPIEDLELLQICQQQRPCVIVINLGSNIQEPLGAYLKAKAGYAPTILCTGGAIDFLTGAQAPIPDWADRLFLGWLFRILSTPKDQAKKLRKSPLQRYKEAWKLFGIVWRNGENVPQTKRS